MWYNMSLINKLYKHKEATLCTQSVAQTNWHFDLPPVTTPMFELELRFI